MTDSTTPPWERAAQSPPPPPAATPARPATIVRSRAARRLAGIGATAVAVVLAGWIGVAAAADGSSTTTTAPPSTATAPAQGTGGPGGPGGRMNIRFGGDMGGKMPGGPVIHGQFVVPNGSGYRTIDEQTGEVTAVSQSSITVKSSDGFTKQYSVTQNTLVDAGRDGIGSVKTGDSVRVSAAESGSSAEAMNIDDMTTTSAIHDHWAPAPPANQGTTNTTTG